MATNMHTHTHTHVLAHKHSLNTHAYLQTDSVIVR